MATDTHPTTAGQRTSPMRVLVAFEDVRSVYGDIFVRAIGDLRPHLTMRSASLGELEHELTHFDPHVVVCSQPSGSHPAGSGAWVQITTEDAREDEELLAEICLDGEHWKTDGPPFSEVLEVIDETHKRLRAGTLSEGC
jgi:hypothetical protein